MANSKKKKEPDNTVKFIAGALGDGVGALIAGPLGAAAGAALTHWAASELMKEGM
jgi:hypothetical protein